MMPVYDGRQMANERLLDVAVHCVQAALKAPQITGRLKFRAEIITGEDLLPIIEIMEQLARLGTVTRWDYLTLKSTYEAGEPPVVIAMGADLTYSELAWDCGACGFPSCGQFNKYSKELKKTRRRPPGPSCNWKLIDYAIACDWACAAAWQYNVDNRVQGSTGDAASLAGYLGGCSVVHCLMLGPCRDMVWYNRESGNKQFDLQESLEFLRQGVPGQFIGFPGTGHAVSKFGERWWEKQPPVYFKPVEDPALEEIRKEVAEKIREIRSKYKPKK